MSGDAPNPQKPKRNIVADMRARPRKSLEEPAEPVSPRKKLASIFRWPREESQKMHDPASLLENNRKLAQRLEALEDRSWEIRESEELHRSLAEAFGDIIVDRNENGEIRFTNRFARNYFGDDHPFPAAELNVSKPGLSPATRDLDICTLLGKRWFSWTDIEIRDGNTGDRHIRSVGRDITERKLNEVKLADALEKAEAASEIKSRFLAMVSHEMRTPINGIAGMARLLTDTSLDAAQRDHVEMINRSIATLLTLVNDLLDSAQIEAGEMQLRPQPTALRELVEQSAEMLAPRAAAKGLTISTFIDPGVPEIVLVDGPRLRQILLNLGGNALKFTESGGIAIEVTGSISGTRAKIKIAVSDSGQGLTAADQKRIFAEFAQAASGSDRQHDGAGLGLFIAQQIAQLMGSTIEVSSSKDRGSRFQLNFEADFTGQAEALLPLQTDLCVALVMEPSPARAALLRSIRSVVKTAYAFDSSKTLHAAVDRGNLTVNFILMDERSASKPDDLTWNKANSPSPRLILINQVGTNSTTDPGKLDGWLTWPVRMASLYKVLSGEDPTRSGPTPKQAKPVGSYPGGSRVLLVEDNKINALVARKFLEKLSCAVTHVSSGREAIATFEQEQDAARTFDHVLLDLNMPEMDGWTVLSALRDLEGAMRRTRVTILSADDRGETRSAAVEKGANGFLAKPLDFDALANLLADRNAG
ncbi:MAG: ATP-binding protein [Rhizobiaceae bacterium]